MLATGDLQEFLDRVGAEPDAVFAYPTETVYGLGCRITSIAGLERICALKGREAVKGMIVLVASLEQARALAVIDERAAAILNRFWPGPLSVLLPARPGLPELLAPGGKIALRHSPLKEATAIVEALGPITSTSANPSGQPASVNFTEVLAYGLDVDAALDAGATPGGQPSTLIDLSGDAPVCLRPGPIAFDELAGL
ncbi:MAG: Threonylcarbamoyl-AMP synthase [Deltaproteobacteria bacterium ADurb.Bin510]|nr:MAG: Threonylcarbamoyl-AMP synthase [Deltaproteobacteria bacterium ADurb.Bin510]